MFRSICDSIVSAAFNSNVNLSIRAVKISSWSCRSSVVLRLCTFKLGGGSNLSPTRFRQFRDLKQPPNYKQNTFATTTSLHLFIHGSHAISSKNIVLVYSLYHIPIRNSISLSLGSSESLHQVVSFQEPLPGSRLGANFSVLPCASGWLVRCFTYFGSTAPNISAQC
jgi:hypothetical protein